MKIRFSKNTGCRYPLDITYQDMPNDVQIMDEAEVVQYIAQKDADALAATNTKEAIDKREAAKQAAEDAADEREAIAQLVKEQLGTKLAARIKLVKAARLKAK